MGKRSILFVANESDFIKDLIEKLSEKDLDCYISCKTEKILALIGEFKPSIIIMDFSTKTEDIFNYVKLIRDRVGVESAQIIGLIKSSNGNLVGRFFEEKIDYYFIDLDIVEHIVDKIKYTLNYHDIKRELDFLSHILEYTSQKLEDSERMQSEFITNISHEIRTPLSVIIGFSELVTLKLVNDGLVSYTKSINTAAKGLLDLINDILRLSEIESGGLVIQSETICLESFINEIGVYYGQIFKETGIEFICNIDESIPKYIITDSSVLRQILFNLVGNALKYTNEGYVKISVFEENYDPNKRNKDLVFLVEDTGKGIKAQDEDYIYQSVGKAGLGLSICRKLLIMTGGDLKFESREGGGTIFRVEIQVEVP